MSLQASISNAIQPIIEDSGNYLEEVKINVAGKKRQITVIVDSNSHLNLDQVTEISRKISPVIEELPEIGNAPFNLEVTSPGIDRPLTLPRHWRKNIGKLVKVVKSDGTLIEGRILNSNENNAQLDNGEVEFTEIKKANLVIEFNK